MRCLVRLVLVGERGVGVRLVDFVVLRARSVFLCVLEWGFVVILYFCWLVMIVPLWIGFRGFAVLCLVWVFGFAVLVLLLFCFGIEFSL